MTSGFKGSPAPQTSRKETFATARSSWIMRRHTVGGAQKVVTLQRSSTPKSALALNGAWLTISTVAPAFHGAKKVLQACLAQPGEEMLTCTSPGCRPSQYIVESEPTG
jgi:hypothetical protein